MSWWADKISGGTPQAAPRPTYTRIDQAVTHRGTYEAQQVPCPGCGGPNFGGGGTGRPRCFDCGYPIVQAGTGTNAVAVPVLGQSAARQVEGEGYNPTTIVGRLD